MLLLWACADVSWFWFCPRLLGGPLGGAARALKRSTEQAKRSGAYEETALGRAVLRKGTGGGLNGCSRRDGRGGGDQEIALLPAGLLMAGGVQAAPPSAELRTSVPR